jgi:DNA-binding NarL/FixJ family response regulator
MTRLLVVHRSPVVRYGFIKLLEELDDGAAVTEAGTVTEALQRMHEADVDLVLMGLSFDGRGGLELLKAIGNFRPTPAVLVFSAHSEELYARRCFQAGASGYLTNDSSRAEVVHAIQQVMSGRRYVSPGLSDRESEVMRLLASGKTVGEIALLLSLSDRTISTYRARLRQKI